MNESAKIILEGRHPFYEEYKNVCKFGNTAYEVLTSIGPQTLKGQQIEVLYYASLEAVNPIIWKQFHQAANGLLKRGLIIRSDDEIYLSETGKELFDILSKMKGLLPKN